MTGHTLVPCNMTFRKAIISLFKDLNSPDKNTVIEISCYIYSDVPYDQRKHIKK